MNFKLSMNQSLIQKSAREFFTKECPTDKTREMKNDPIGYDPSVWQKMVELGFVSILIPMEFGGMQGEFMELKILIEELGRNTVPGPFFETVCLCTPALMTYGSEDQKYKYLKEIADKGTIWTLALDETGTWDSAHEIQMAATTEDDCFRLNGTKLFVPFAESSEYMLVAARTGEQDMPDKAVTVFIVPTKTAGIEMEEIPTAAPGTKYAVHFKDVMVPKTSLLGPVGGGRSVIDQMIRQGALLKAAEMAGGAQAALDISLRYAKDRIQFGRPIGSFQAIQHKFVRMLQEVDGLKNLVNEAAWRIDQGHPSALLNAMAKAKANKVYHRVCFDALVIHGAIGWTEEMDISLYLLRSKDLENSCGDSDFHKEIIARELEDHQEEFITN